MTFYANAHSRVKRLWGSASQYTCVLCPDTARDWAYDGHDPDEQVSGRSRRRYSNHPEFYMPLCRPCHLEYDKKMFRIRGPLELPQIVLPRSEHEWDEYMRRAKKVAV